MTYFEQGIDRAALVVGFQKSCNEHPDEVALAKALLGWHCTFLKTSIFASFPYLQIFSIKNGDLDTLLYSSDWGRQRFSHLSDEARLLRESIFRLQFVSERLLPA